MKKQSAHVVKPQSFIFVLWGDRFEEMVATTFVSALRDAGLGVKVVGLNGQQSIGKNGMTIGSDVTLGEAMHWTKQATCVIVPCGPGAMKRIENDPRVLDFFKETHGNGAQFVISHAATFAKSYLNKILTSAEEVIFYNERDNLLQLSSEMVVLLSNRMATA